MGHIGRTWISDQNEEAAPQRSRTPLSINAESVVFVSGSYSRLIFLANHHKSANDLRSMKKTLLAVGTISFTALAAFANTTNNKDWTSCPVVTMNCGTLKKTCTTRHATFGSGAGTYAYDSSRDCSEVTWSVTDGCRPLVFPCGVPAAKKVSDPGE